MVPKIRNVDQMSIKEIGEALKKTSKLCRELKIDKKEFFGGSMTISSLGGIGGTFFTPIINPPEVAILGVGKSFDRLVKSKNKIISRKILPISLSYDHRIIDGAEGARFCVYLGECLERFCIQACCLNQITIIKIMNKKLFSITAAIACSFLWGTAFIAQDTGMDYIGPWTFSGARLVLGFIALLPFFFIFEFKKI